MQIFKYYPVTVLLIGWVLMTSCKKEAAGDNTPRAGRLIGTVQTWDDKLISTTDGAGIIVTITNLTGVETVSDANGKFEFSNLAFDNYDLSFSKSGYGTYRVFGISHQFNPSQSFTVVPTIGFGKISTTTVTALSVTGNVINGEPGVLFSYGLNPVPSTSSRAFVRYFLSNSPAVSYTNYSAYSDLINFSNLSNITGFTQRELISLGFSSGQTVYVRLYGDSFRSNDYTDPNTGLRIFPNINPASVPAVSFVVP